MYLVGQDPPWEGAVLGGIFWLVVKYRECLSCGQRTQRCSVGGISDVAYRSQSCSS